MCALVEVPAALSLTLLPARMRKHRAILLGMVLFVAYFLLVAASSTMPLLIGTQLARGVTLAVVGALGITYVQDLLPQATGRATALYGNTLTTGSLISGILAGATAQALGHRAAAAVRRPQRRRVRAVGQRPPPRAPNDTDLELEPSTSPARPSAELTAAERTPMPFDQPDHAALGRIPRPSTSERLAFCHSMSSPPRNTTGQEHSGWTSRLT